MMTRLGPLARLLMCVIAALLVVGAGAAPTVRQATGQQPEPGSPAPAPLPSPQQPPVGPGPDVFEVAVHAQIVADSAARAERVVAGLAVTEPLEAEFRELAQRHTELQALLSAMLATEFVRLERLTRLRDQALLESARLEELRDQVVQRISELGELRSRWLTRRQDWQEWRTRLAEDPDFPVVAAELDTALVRIEAVVIRISDAATELLSLQRRTEELRGDIQQLAVVATQVRDVRRQARLRRGEPVLLSAEHRAQLAEEGLRQWRPVDAIRPAAYVAFVREHPGILFFHLLLALALGFTAKRLGRVGHRGGDGDGEGTGDGDRDRGADAWSGLLDYPWMLGILASVAVAAQRIVLAPPLWDVLLWVLFGAAAAVLSQRLVAVRALRWTIYLLAIFYPLFLVLEAVELPVPVFRVGMAVVAAVAVPVFLVLGRRKAAAAAAGGRTGPIRRWPLRIGAALWVAVFVATVVGFDALGRWLLHATVTSAAVVFLVALAFALIRGATGVLLTRMESTQRVGGAGARLAQRLISLFRIAVAVAATLVLLDIWGLAESPALTWQRMISAAVEVGPIRITLGQVLLGLIVLYGAVLISNMARAVVTTSVERKHEADRGLSESVSRLVHYAIITLGVILALGALGFELQNFAIIAGALGIGVGFGLQNVVNNFASGLILLFERPVRVGDTVVVDEVWGTIQKIGLRSTIMLTFDKSEMIVPNADLVSEKVTNWTLSNPTARIILPVGVAYGSPIDQVLQILVESAAAHEDVLDEPPPEALFAEFGDSSLDFELRVWVINIRRRLQVRSEVLAEVDRRFREAGIEIPFPQRDLHLRSVDGDAAKQLR